MDSAIIKLQKVWITLKNFFAENYCNGKILLVFILDTWKFFILDDKCVCL